MASAATPLAKPQAPSPTAKRILVADDDPLVLRAYGRALRGAGYSVELASDGRKAADLVNAGAFDVILSDIAMPELDGLQLLRIVRERDLDVPVILVTATPALDTAMKAVEYGALRYMVKPVDLQELERALQEALRLHELAKLKREALKYFGSVELQLGDRASLEASFERALSSLWMAFQPIVCWPKRAIYAHEALLRTDESTMPNPGIVLSAAERLGRLNDLGRAIRGRVAQVMSQNPSQTVFVNLHARDLMDETLYLKDAPISHFAKNVVLELTERAALDEIENVPSRVKALRELGFRIAVDDLGAGYAGLASFAILKPDIVKLDISLVRDVDKEPTKRKLIHSMTTLCREMGMQVISEGVETVAERDTLSELGCELLQGFLFARPGRMPAEVSW
jgi:EAL domain-containing protein (putative c-di-GMP-specific phosphodiesterase class I)